MSKLSTGDDQLLGQTLRDLSLLDLDFSLDLTGFSVGEIDRRDPRLHGDEEPPYLGQG